MHVVEVVVVEVAAVPVAVVPNVVAVADARAVATDTRAIGPVTIVPVAKIAGKRRGPVATDSRTVAAGTVATKITGKRRGAVASEARPITTEARTVSASLARTVASHISG
jgi:hypothetical protein